VGWLKKLLLGGGGLALGLMLLLMAWNRVAEVAMDRRVAAVRAQGIPASPEELDAWYPEPPKEESPAVTCEEAFDLMAKKQGETPLVDELGVLPDGPLTADDLETLRPFLTDREDIVALLREGSTRGFAPYPLDFKEPGGPTLPHLPKLRDAVRLLALDALVRAEDGDTDGAIEDLVAAVGLAESLAEEPALMSQLVRCACHVTAIDYTARVLNAAEPDSAQLEALQKAFAEAEARDTFYRGFVGELALAMPFFRNYESIFQSRGMFQPPAQRYGLLKLVPTGLRERDYDYYTDRMTALIDAARGSIPSVARRFTASRTRRRLGTASDPRSCFKGATRWGRTCATLPTSAAPRRPWRSSAVARTPALCPVHWRIWCRDTFARCRWTPSRTRPWSTGPPRPGSWYTASVSTATTTPASISPREKRAATSETSTLRSASSCRNFHSSAGKSVSHAAPTM